MKILAIHAIGSGRHEPAAHLWRLFRPLNELQKHVDWTIDHQTELVASMDEHKDKDSFTEEELAAAAERLGQYDIVFVSYSNLNLASFVLLQAVQNLHGTQFVVDYDDDIFSVNEDNPIWLQISHQRMWDLQTIARTAPHIVVSTEHLAQVIRSRRQLSPETVTVIPNFISDDYQHPAIDHGERVTIGYFGGSSHWDDVHESGFRKALAKIVKAYPQVDVRSNGMPIDIPISEKRITYVDGAGGRQWVTDVFPTLDMDIVVAPLLDNQFNYSKSNIKWQEATRMGAAVIASNIGPYALLPTGTAIKVQNTRQAWYNAMEYLIKNAAHRRTMVNRAQADLNAFERLEDHWPLYRDLFENIGARP